MKIHCILGTTGVGKTARSVELAKQLNAPVIGIDRFQLINGLETGSGCPLEEELEGTRRLYVTPRRDISEGALDSNVACDHLHGLLEQLSRTEQSIILEGGSISLWTCILECRLLAP